MKKVLMLACAMLVSGFATAALDTTECDKIKNKVKRGECFEALVKQPAPKKVDDEISEFVKKGKQNVIDHSSDPDSVRFRNLVLVDNLHGEAKDGSLRALCGEVNAKNKFGGYDGYRRFISSVFTDGRASYQPLIEEPINPRVDISMIMSRVFVAMWKEQCATERVVWKE